MRSGDAEVEEGREERAALARLYASYCAKVKDVTKIRSAFGTRVLQRTARARVALAKRRARRVEDRQQQVRTGGFVCRSRGLSVIIRADYMR